MEKITNAISEKETPCVDVNDKENEFSKKELFILEEYKTAVRLTFDVDNQRNTITKFYLLFAGVAVSSVVFLIDKGSVAHFEKVKLTACLLLGISLVGVLTVAVLARLRRVQIEHFGIICNIRDYFLKDDFEMRNVIVLSSESMPEPNIKSGTYLWLCIVMFVNAAILSLSCHIYFIIMTKVINENCSDIFYTISTIIAFIAQSLLYFRLTKPRVYDKRD